MANYSVGNIEIGVMSNSAKALSNIDLVINKLQEFNKIDKNLQNIFLRINQLGNGLTKLSKINVETLNSKIGDISKSTESLVNKLSQIKQPTFTETAESLNKIANAFRQFNNLKNFDFSKMEQSFANINTIITPFLQKLKESETSLVAMSNVLSNLKTKTITKASQELDKASKSSKNLKKNIDKIDFNKFINVGKIYFLFNYSKRIVGGIGRMLGYASDYAEILNKFQVSFGSIYEDNLKSINQLATAFGFSTNTLLDYTSTFNNMLKSLGNLSNEANATISQTLTRMAIDYSSLFNVSIERAMSAFQSAISGNIRTLRSISGFDVSEITIFSIYQEMGGTKTMRQLNQLEKRLLRIIAIQRQMEETGALGDYGRTIETVSNQVKIFQENLIEVGKWIGMNLMVYIKPAIQYANAILLTIKEMAKSLALVKEQTEKIDYEKEFAGFGESVESTTGAIEDLNESMTSLLGFDKLNILGSSTSSATSGLLVEQKILDSLKEYNMVLDNVNYKAKDISEQMLTWLGYTKQLNGETGETNWVLGEGYTNLEKIKDVVTGIVTFLVTNAIFTKVAGLVTSIKSMSVATEGMAIAGSGVATTLGAIGLLVAGIVAVFKNLYDNSEEFRASVDKAFATIKENAKKVFDLLGKIWDKIKPVFNWIWDFLKNNIGTTILMMIIKPIEAFTELITGDFKGAFLSILEIFEIFGNRVKDIFGSIKPFFQNIGDFIINYFKMIVNNIIGFINEKLIKSVNKLSIPVPDWLGGGNIGFNIKELDYLPLNQKNDIGSDVVNTNNVSSNIDPNGAMIGSLTPVVNSILESNDKVIKAIESKDQNIYMNGRKVSEALYNDMESVAIRKGKQFALSGS